MLRPLKGFFFLPRLDNPQDNVCEPSCHHAGVEAQGGPGRHRKSQRCQTGKKHLFPVQNAPEQLPRGLRGIPAPGDISPIFGPHRVSRRPSTPPRFCVFIPRREAPDKSHCSHAVHHMTNSMGHLIDSISTLANSLLISQTSLIRPLLWNSFFFFLFGVG